jgi:hypothetical protein
MRIILFLLILLAGCQTEVSEPKSVSFEVKGIYLGSRDDFFKENSVQRHKGSNSILTIFNRTDKVIYIPTDSCNIYMPPLFHSTNREIIDTMTQYKGEIFLEGFIKIMPNTSKKITTRVPPYLPKLSKISQIKLIFAYTNDYKGVHSTWQLIKKRFEFDSLCNLKPLIP